MSIKCSSCGLVNWDTACNCRRCQAPIQSLVPAPPRMGQARPQPAPFAQPQTQQPCMFYAGHQTPQNTQPFASPPAPLNGASFASWPAPANASVYADPGLEQDGVPCANGQPFENPGMYPNPQAFPDAVIYQRQFSPPKVQASVSAAGFPAPFPEPAGYAANLYMRPPAFPTQPSITPKLKVLLAVMIIGAAVFLVAIRGVHNKGRLETIGEKALTVKYLKVPNQEASSIEALRENLLVYLGKDKDPRFGYDEIQRQLFIGVDDVVYDQEKGEVLLLVKGNPDSGAVQRVIASSVTNPALTFYGEACKQKINPFRGKTTVGWANHSPLVVPADNIRINPYTNVEIKYRSATYIVSVQELSDFMTDKMVYGGHMRIFSKDRRHNELNVFGNHGAFVGRAGEPSLTRLANLLIGNATTLDQGLRESRIQKLVDFVSQEITYDESEAKFKGEILKRPDETLLTRRGDCSSKAILLASLLEQTGEEYRLVYYNDHITVAVRKGNFPNLNGLSLSLEGEAWIIAETTLPGFQIGETIVENPQIFSTMRYVQKPGNSESVSVVDEVREIVFE